MNGKINICSHCYHNLPTYLPEEKDEYDFCSVFKIKNPEKNVCNRYKSYNWIFIYSFIFWNVLFIVGGLLFTHDIRIIPSIILANSIYCGSISIPIIILNYIERNKNISKEHSNE